MSDDGSTPPPPESDPAHEWFRNVYQGDHVRQLSVRSIVTGMLIGGVMSVSNLYVGLKTGWGLGVTITASIIAYAVFQALERIVPAYRKNPFTILENYTMSSAASAAGYMSSAGLVSAIPALYLTTGRQLTWWELMTWIGAVSALGVFMAIPLKRQLINIEQLPFPSGIATAETLKSMHTEGEQALSKARSLFGASLIGGLLAFWKDFPSLLPKESAASLGKFAFPAEFPLLGGTTGRKWLDDYTIGIEGSLIMVAAGAIMGLRVGISLLAGALIYYGILGPWLIEVGWAKPGYRGLVTWTLWPATAMMVTSGLLSFGLKWRTIVRAMGGLMTAFSRSEGPREHDPMDDIEVPTSWFVAGTFLTGLACVLLGHFLFEITWWMGIIAVLVTFLLSIVAARATGETDVTPIGAMGKITQLLYGWLAPSNITTNLMTASITSGAASHSADLLTDLKTGYLLGGNPRKQTISQLFGVLAGTLVCVPVYMVVVDPTKLGSKELPAPSAKVWEGVANLLSKGVANLPEGTVTAMIIGGLIGIILTLCEEFLPKEYKKWVPSSTGLSIAGVIPAFNSISMFAGALIAWTIAKFRKDIDEQYTIPFSSGLIAGESLIGVAIILLTQGPGLIMTLFGGGK